ncbi:MAG: hypothetical protein ACREOI_13125 [bacterium]
MLETTIGILRWIHIMAGFTAFFVAPMALATQKGGTTHRRWGKVYFWGMTVGTITALVVAAYRPNIFLLLIAVFSFYLSFSGYRVLWRKRPDKGQKASALDWTVALITLSASAYMIVRGSLDVSTGNVRLNPVLIIFGILGALAAGEDLYKFLRPPKEKYAWFLDHMSGMVASYIAAVSAFSVVNFSFLPPLVRWLWPTAVGVPLLSIWVRSYRRKFTQRSRSIQVETAKVFASMEVSG